MQQVPGSGAENSHLAEINSQLAAIKFPVRPHRTPFPAAKSAAPAPHGLSGETPAALPQGAIRLPFVFDELTAAPMKATHVTRSLISGKPTSSGRRTTHTKTL
jgi:hypothetical protein